MVKNDIKVRDILLRFHAADHEITYDKALDEYLNGIGPNGVNNVFLNVETATSQLDKVMKEIE